MYVVVGGETGDFIKNIECLEILEATSCYFSHILHLHDFMLDQSYNLLQAIRLNVHQIFCVWEWFMTLKLWKC